ncbi:MAG TPA: hypothetical protein VKR30_05645 [Candidatus Limnocylindrales bacterium]|nr:hypothetical protein [Candidatus Limnocylindrales bacterium]
MRKGRWLGVLAGAGLLTLAAVGTVQATAPTYTLTVTKAADPATLPFGGGTTTYTITVDNTGTGDFHVVNVTDANCDTSTLAWQSGTGSSTAGPSGTGSAAFLHGGDSWTFTCTRALTDPGTYDNTATADGCTDGSVDECNNSSHAAEATSNDAQVVVLAATPAPTGGGGGNTNAPTEPPTDAVPTGTSSPADGAWLLIAALGALLGSLVILRPSKTGRHR